jgi:hypothetical protein
MERFRKCEFKRTVNWGHRAVRLGLHQGNGRCAEVFEGTAADDIARKTNAYHGEGESNWDAERQWERQWERNDGGRLNEITRVEVSLSAKQRKLIKLTKQVNEISDQQAVLLFEDDALFCEWSQTWQGVLLCKLLKIWRKWFSIRSDFLLEVIFNWKWFSIHFCLLWRDQAITHWSENSHLKLNFPRKSLLNNFSKI